MESQKTLSYTEAFSRLKEIQRLIESNKLEVDELEIKLEEAAELMKICKDKLYTVNEGVKKIMEKIQ
ncbi:MAG: exodeoxyribonuclease VII small subunit [Dysgonamonadaceae bacterium]|jgi:exodeoxyribonuclease VII small subunit|nr:exodeoxyribonuclease VII small subunit [Dysgonamonadaceae bacterium]